MSKHRCIYTCFVFKLSTNKLYHYALKLMCVTKVDQYKCCIPLWWGNLFFRILSSKTCSLHFVHQDNLSYTRYWLHPQEDNNNNCGRLFHSFYAKINRRALNTIKKATGSCFISKFCNVYTFYKDVTDKKCCTLENIQTNHFCFSKMIIHVVFQVAYVSQSAHCSWV